VITTPRTSALLAAILDRDGELCERNAPAAFVQTCKSLEHALARLDWRPVAAGLPRAEDVNAAGEVEWSNGDDIWAGHSSEFQQLGATHWRPIHLPTL
jgi:hypothetical protein